MTAQEFKQIMTWVLGFIFMTLVGLIAWNGNRMVASQDQMSQTLTTMMIHQQDIDRRVTGLEDDNTDNKEHWKAHDEFTRTFFETYDLKKKK